MIEIKDNKVIIRRPIPFRVFYTPQITYASRQFVKPGKPHLKWAGAPMKVSL